MSDQTQEEFQRKQNERTARIDSRLGEVMRKGVEVFVAEESVDSLFRHGQYWDAIHALEDKVAALEATLDKAP